nr:hypothetical protein [Variovorax sp. CY25R-8]
MLGGIFHSGPALAGVRVTQQRDRAEQARDDGPGLRHSGRIAAQRLLQVHDQLPVARSDLAGAGQRRGRLFQRGLQSLPLELRIAKACRQCLACANGDDGIHDALYLAVELNAAPASGRLRTLLPAIQLGQQALDGGLNLGECFRAEQILAQLCQQALVDIGPAPGCRAAARGRSLVFVRAAAVSAPIDRRDGTAARVAAEQATEQRAMRAAACRIAALEFVRAGLVPKRLVDDAQVRRFAHEPFFARPRHR